MLRPRTILDGGALDRLAELPAAARCPPERRQPDLFAPQEEDARP